MEKSMLHRFVLPLTLALLFVSNALNAKESETVFLRYCMTPDIAKEVVSAFQNNTERGREVFGTYAAHGQCAEDIFEKKDVRLVKSFTPLSYKLPNGEIATIFSVIIADPYFSPRQAIYLIEVRAEKLRGRST